MHFLLNFLDQGPMSFLYDAKHTGALVRLYVILALSLTSGWAVRRNTSPAKSLLRLKIKDRTDPLDLSF